MGSNPTTPTTLSLSILALVACAGDPASRSRAEADSVCLEQCDARARDEGEPLIEVDSCAAFCECALDWLASEYPDEELGSLLAEREASEQQPTPEMKRIGEECVRRASLLPDADDTDLFQIARYSKHLRAAHEARIEPTRREGVEVYRLLVLPSFEPTLVVRVTRSQGEIQVVTKRLSGAGGYEPGEVEWEREGAVAEADWRELERLLAASDFWCVPPGRVGCAPSGDVRTRGGFSLHPARRWHEVGARRR